MSEEKMVLVREVGQEEFGLMFLTELVDGRPLTIEELHESIADAVGKPLNDTIIKLSLDGIVIRNANGLRFLFKKEEPKLEVTFKSTNLAGSTPQAQQPAQQQIPGSAVPMQYQPANQGALGGILTQSWLTLVDKAPYLYGHTSTVVNNQLLVWGGFIDGTECQKNCYLLNDINEHGNWYRLTVNGDVPVARERHTATLIGKRIYFIGGYDRANEVYFNTVHYFDTELMTWTKLEPTGNIPERRCSHSAVAIDGKIWVFGGRCKVNLGSSFFSGTGVQYRNDLYCFDPVRCEWSRYEPRGSGPSGRSMHSAINIGKKMYVFGGAQSTGVRDDTTGFCDLYELDIETMTWTEVETKGTPPTPCYGHSMTLVDNDRVLFFGGKGFTVTNHIHILYLADMQWKKYAFGGNPLVPRWGHSATLHGNRVALYGGRDESGYWNTLDVIDVDQQLIELAPEETAADILRREAEEAGKRREIIGKNKQEMEELKIVITRIGEELMNQKREKETILRSLNAIGEENAELRRKIQEYLLLKTTRGRSNSGLSANSLL
eukprot:TRINITY_DN12729_c0_g1_i1.p1 TRINITY_DN12729_c0_g1~~TRINITY_DN12729_c0_g1_i1.p1  ORF type:complete len:547 (-),score=113.97 TRINITY_DN12729_c0_g1_i1:75-1715(-)